MFFLNVRLRFAHVYTAPPPTNICLYHPPPIFKFLEITLHITSYVYHTLFISTPYSILHTSYSIIMHPTPHTIQHTPYSTLLTPCTLLYSRNSFSILHYSQKYTYTVFLTLNSMHCSNWSLTVSVKSIGQ